MFDSNWWKQIFRLRRIRRTYCTAAWPPQARLVTSHNVVEGLLCCRLSFKQISSNRSADSKLTGYNHYPSCRCGWCVGGGNRGSHSNPTPKKPARPAYSEQEKHDAKQTLNSYGASSYSRCFVNPNAVCPVCGQSVYFYSNSFGSRVFFDELGKPWTKHPCTDSERTTSSAVKAYPVRRPRVEIERILEAEKKIDQRILPASKKAKKSRGSWLW
jgi:hypothetical protein